MPYPCGTYGITEEAGYGTDSTFFSFSSQCLKGCDYRKDTDADDKSVEPCRSVALADVNRCIISTSHSPSNGERTEESDQLCGEGKWGCDRKYAN